MRHIFISSRIIAVSVLVAAAKTKRRKNNLGRPKVSKIFSCSVCLSFYCSSLYMLLSVLCFIVSVCISGWFVYLCIYFLWAMLPDTNIYLSIYLSIAIACVWAIIGYVAERSRTRRYRRICTSSASAREMTYVPAKRS